MSKLSNCIKMLTLLKSRGKMKIKELAEILEVSERMIRVYKDDLEKAGIYLLSERGQDGGYYLDESSFLFNLKLKDDEISALHTVRGFLEKNNNFLLLEEYDNALDKINAATDFKGQDNKTQYYLTDSSPNIKLDLEKKKYIDINSAIISRNKISIKYFSLTSKLTERIIRPYSLFIYKGFWYCIGYCELRKKVRDFKLSRIKEYKVIDEKFEIPKDFNIKDFIGSNSIFNDKTYKVKLKIKYPTSIIVSESIWGDKQKITFNDDYSILFEAEMTGKPEIISWILSMGSSVTIIEPKEIINEIKKEVDEMKKMY
ncbi:helix-turn-helix transcriptional regulator [Caldisalinibacter kiritimatiensis]|uniref:helix-turn-helix transcriptional regulator n=1 Tax=Caldisalinibacter kiritimatiensis TaxID=1304284 RepID=UPI0004B19790|nr:transcriptional regulator [Caldisalinibacter kiritimatiensis]